LFPQSDNVESKSKVSTPTRKSAGFKWGNKLDHFRDKQFYSEFTLNGLKYKQGDIITLIVDESVCFAVLIHMWENSKSEDTKEIILRWFYREKDLNKKLANQLKEYENCVVLSKAHYDVNPLSVIEGKCGDIKNTKDCVKFTWESEEYTCPSLLFCTQKKALEKIKGIRSEVGKIEEYSEICDN